MKKKVTKEFIESLPFYVGIRSSSIIKSLSGRKYKDYWSFTYKNNKMTIEKGDKYKWGEVLKIIINDLKESKRNHPHQ